MFPTNGSDGRVRAGLGGGGALRFGLMVTLGVKGGQKQALFQRVCYLVGHEWVPFRDPAGSNNKSCLYVKADKVKYRGGQAKKSDPCLAVFQSCGMDTEDVLLALLVSKRLTSQWLLRILGAERILGRRVESEEMPRCNVMK